MKILRENLLTEANTSIMGVLSDVTITRRLSPTRKSSRRTPIRWGSPTERVPGHLLARRRRTAKRARNLSPRQNHSEQLSELGLEETYFSPRLPVQPMRMVLIGHPSEEMLQNKRLRRFIENVCNIEEQINPGAKVEPAIPPSAYSFLSPLFFSTTSTSPAERMTPCRRYASKEERPCSANTEPNVRHLLSDLITKLPLSSSCQEITLNKTKLRQATSQSSMVPLEPASSRCSTSAGSCSIGVQAFGFQNTAASPISSNTGYTAGRYANNLSTEWVGGMRALRDLHVRLVLRQLRHIDKLNRALDNASSSDGLGNLNRQKRKTKTTN